MTSHVERSVGRCDTTGKSKFTTRKAAKANARYHNRAGELRPYICGHCGYFHLGHGYGQTREWHQQLHHEGDNHAQDDN